MSKVPVISIFASAVYTGNWMAFYESLSCNEVKFEIIFVGDRAPGFILPGNFHFIFSEVKPSQCAEIASRRCRGELIMNIADDLIFSPYALDRMLEMRGRLSSDLVMISARYVKHGKDLTDEGLHYCRNKAESPKMPVGGLISKDVWLRLGGIDRRFIALCWDLDIAMRLYEIGGDVVFCEDAYVEEVAVRRKRRLYACYGAKFDRPLLDSFWGTNETNRQHKFLHCVFKDKNKGAISRTRLSPVVKFDDEDIMTVSQGPKGRWR